VSLQSYAFYQATCVFVAETLVARPHTGPLEMILDTIVAGPREERTVKIAFVPATAAPSVVLRQSVGFARRCSYLSALSEDGVWTLHRTVLCVPYTDSNNQPHGDFPEKPVASPIANKSPTFMEPKRSLP
jgi:hypothetical protein